MEEEKTSENKFAGPLKNTEEGYKEGIFNPGDLSAVSHQGLQDIIRELMLSQKKLSDLYNFAPVGYFTLDLEGIIHEVNLTGANVLGVEQTTLKGNPIQQFIVEDSMESFRDHRRALLDTHAPQACELIMKRSDGSEFHGHLECSVIENADNGPIQIRMAAIDITARKKAEEEHAKMEEKMNRIHKFESLNVMAGSIAHNFNNLLMGVLGNLELVTLEMPPHSQVMGYIDHATDSAKRAAELSHLMLTYVGQNKGDPQSVNMTELVSGMTGILKASVSLKAQLLFKLASESAFFKGDPDQIRKIVINLILNAAEAIENDKGTILISTGTMFCHPSDFHQPFDESLPEGLYVYVEVTDSGCGMDEETQSKAFDPFFTTKHTGRGLGLSTVLGIVRSHGGAVFVTSTPGEGTAVKTLFPCWIPSVQAPLEVPGDAALWHGRGTILLVDDEEFVLEVSKNMLAELGLRVLTAQDGDQAVEIFREHCNHIDCVILDIVSAPVNGVETLHQLRTIKEDVPVILASGYNKDQVADIFDGVLPGPFIAKPFQLSRLAEIMKEVLAQKD
ncbi:MAG: response regulator [bacterium]|nr:response regulator [bacterium]